MGTRCTISTKDENGEYFIFRHWDGYPDAVVPDILKALPYAWELPRFEADEFITALVCAFKDGAGNIRFAKSHEQYGDTEYKYYITLKDNKLHLKIFDIYENKYIFDSYYEDALSKWK